MAYTAAIEACLHGGAWAQALQFLAEMKENNIRPNTSTYSLAMKVLNSSMKWKEALLIHEEMMQDKANQGGATLFAHNMAIRAQQLGGQWEKAMELFAELEAKKNTRPNYFTYKCILGLNASFSQWETGLHLLRRMKTSGVKPRISCYNHVLRAMTASGMYDEAIDLFLDMQESGSMPDVVAYSSVLSACQALDSRTLGLAMMKEMTANGVVYEIVS